MQFVSLEKKAVGKKLVEKNDRAKWESSLAPRYEFYISNVTKLSRGLVEEYCGGVFWLAAVSSS